MVSRERIPVYNPPTHTHLFHTHTYTDYLIIYILYFYGTFATINELILIHYY